MTTRFSGATLASLHQHLPTPVDPHEIFKEALWMQSPVGEQHVRWNNGH